MANRQVQMAKKRNPIDRVTLIILGVFVVLAIITGIVVFSTARNIFKSWTTTSIGGVPVDASNGNPSNGPAVPMDQVLQTDGPQPDQDQ